MQSIRIGELFLYKGDYRLCHKSSGMVRKSPQKMSCCPASLFSEIHEPLYDKKTGEQLHYTSLSVLDYALVTGHKTTVVTLCSVSSFEVPLRRADRYYDHSAP